jgi:DNA ligase (NAD+)
MDDETYDTLLDTLREKDLTNPFLDTLGAPPPTGQTAPLPFPMGSLEKLKPGMPSLARFLSQRESYVLSEKLDGLSALWCPAKKALYLRGDGRVGQPIHHLVQTIQGLVPSSEDWVIRGEIIIPRTQVEAGQIARTIVNGLVHRKEALAPADQKKLRFVAYEVLQPAPMTREDQFLWLQSHGFEVPWWTAAVRPTEADLSRIFPERRTKSPYDMDGIVIGMNQVPQPSTSKNPKDCMAFKMPLSDQSATTTVQEVLWAPSAQGYLIPRIRFTPVSIGGATIEFCTGHNARTIVNGSIGPGAVIRIRRSGDVIPTLETVLTPASAPQLPPNPSAWKWGGDDDASATHIQAIQATPEQRAAQLLHAMKHLEIPSMGPSNCKALVDHGLGSLKAIWGATQDQLTGILGPKTGAAFYTHLRTALSPATITECDLLIASSLLPRGVGESKLASLFTHLPDPLTWTTAKEPPKGWTETSFREFQTLYPVYEEWRRKELSWIPYPCNTGVAPTQQQQQGPQICFTGFRDAALQARATQRNFTCVDSVTSKLKLLIVADGAKSSEKRKKAESLGTVEILERTQFIQKYLS